jgi:integrase
MPKLKESTLPAYRLHKQSGQAVVTLNGRDHLLGKHDSAASRAEYNRLLAEWIAADRRAPVKDGTLTVSELLKAFKNHAQSYYGTSREEEHYRHALRPLRKMYGDTDAAVFGPLKLKALRETMIDGDRVKLAKLGEMAWSRNYANRQISRIKHVFKWGVEYELIPASVHHALSAVAGLRYGRTDARETEPVQPVADEIVDATLPHLSNVVRTMVQVQRLTGARPGEVCAMKIGEIDRSGPVWSYRLPKHKTAHLGNDRIVQIGPKAQAVLSPFLMKLDPTAHVFSPAAAKEEMKQRRADARKTPLSCGNKPGSNRQRRPGRLAGEFYIVASYRRAIARACDDAFPAPAEMVKPEEIRQWRCDRRWHPHQLRHSAATQIRAAFGIEAAQHTLGHKKIDITAMYAEKNAAVARQVAAQIG